VLAQEHKERWRWEAADGFAAQRAAAAVVVRGCVCVLCVWGGCCICGLMMTLVIQTELRDHSYSPPFQKYDTAFQFCTKKPTIAMQRNK
jgi:hypothetical protein